MSSSKNELSLHTHHCVYVNEAQWQTVWPIDWLTCVKSAWMCMPSIHTCIQYVWLCLWKLTHNSMFIHNRNGHLHHRLLTTIYHITHQSIFADSSLHHIEHATKMRITTYDTTEYEVVSKYVRNKATNCKSSLN